MSDPLIRRADDIEYEAVDAADGLEKGVLIGEEGGGGNLAIRRFTLAPGGSVPKHTNDIEHEQYVLSGRYTVGIEGEEHDVEAGDSSTSPPALSTGTATTATNRARSSVRFPPATTKSNCKGDPEQQFTSPVLGTVRARLPYPSLVGQAMLGGTERGGRLREPRRRKHCTERSEGSAQRGAGA